MKNICVPDNPSVGLSILEIAEAIANEVEVYTLDGFEENRAQFRQLCMIIAEVLALPDNATIPIEGIPFPASNVKEMYLQIQGTDLEDVVRKYKKIDVEVRNIKRYLRTMLYNAVYEREAYWTNQARVDGVI